MSFWANTAEERYHHEDCDGCSSCLPPSCATCDAELTEEEIAARKSVRRDDCHRCAEPETVETPTLTDAELLELAAREGGQ